MNPEEANEIDLIEAIFPEVWLQIFEFLDVASLLSVQKVCSLFYHLCNLEYLWKKKCSALFHVPDAEVENQQDVGSSKSWKTELRRLSSIKIEGTYNIYSSIIYDRSSMHSSVYKMACVLPEQSDMDRSLWLSQFLNEKTSCQRIEGYGEAPWGSFDIIGCRMGSYVVLTQVYYGYAYLTCGLQEYMSDGSMRGTWKSNWQYASGASILAQGNKKTIKELIFEHVHAMADVVDEREKLGAQFQGTWDLTFDRDQDDTMSTSNEPTSNYILMKDSFTLRAIIPKRTGNQDCGAFGGVCGGLNKQEFGPSLRSSILLGTVHTNSIFGCSIVIDHEEHGREILVLIARFTNDRLVGRFASRSSKFTGKVVGIKKLPANN